MKNSIVELIEGYFGVSSQYVEIRFWSDGDWEYTDTPYPNLHECKSDDYLDVNIPIEANINDIEEFIQMSITGQLDSSTTAYWKDWLLINRV